MSGSSLVDDVHALFRGLENARGVVLAVSGGPDSTALMHLARDWHDTHKATPMKVATVDHGLRAGSDAVAARVAAAAEMLGFASRILVWSGEKPVRAVQEKARRARYALLDGYAEELGASHLVTAHTLDDQAETVLFRLSRGSGLTGLGGMHTRAQRRGLCHLRPFLSVRKQSLVDLCARNGWPVEADPANVNPRFARVRWRNMAAALAAEGLTPERLAALAVRFQRADAALRDLAHEAAVSCADRRSSDVRRFHGDALMRHPEEVVTRVLAAAFMELGDDDHLRLNRLESLVETLFDSHRRRAPLRRTLHHCLVTLDATGSLSIEREGPRHRGAKGVILPVQSP